MNAERLLALYERVANAPDAIPQLRRFILDLAVRGKLVEQNATEVAAGELLNEIAAAKKKLGIKPSVNPLENGEEPFGLPLGWRWSRIGEVCTKTGSGSTPRGGKEVYKSTGVPFLRSQNVYNDGLRLDDVVYIDLETHERMSGTCVQPGDLLLNITGGSMGRCAHVPADFETANISQHVAIIRSAVRGMDAFMHRLILSPYFQAFIFEEQTGAGRGGLPKNRMDQIVVALPPLAEQQRIVAKVDELMALLDGMEIAARERDATRDRLAAATLARLTAPNTADNTASNARFALQTLPALTTRPDQIKALRHTILNLAVRGKLVEQDPADDPASDLLERIERDIAHYVRSSGARAAKADIVTVEDQLFPLPSGWAWTRLASLCRTVTDGDHQPPPVAEKGVAFLTIGNVTTGKLEFVGCRRVAPEYFASVPSYRKPAKGDLLYTVVGATFGRPVLVDSDEPFCVQRHIAILKPSAEAFVPYLLHLLASPLVYEQAKASTTGTAQPTIALKPLRNFLTPLPPLAEQHRIVARVEALMALCDQLEAALAEANTTRTRLLEALLHEALVSADQKEAA